MGLGNFITILCGIAGLGFLFWIVGYGLLADHMKNKKKANEVLVDYMWCRDAQEFFKAQRIKEQKKLDIIFDDCLEEESARLVSSRVL